MCVALDPQIGQATVLGAGHPPLLIARQEGTHETVWSSAPPLGLADRSQFVEKIVDLAPGDAFVLYTDGLFGSSKGESARLTPDRLAAMMDNTAPTAETMLMQMVKQAAPFDGNGNASDDIAAVVGRRTP
jgi:sigma-B regulation protein RsbU (phosphoserine phosphatase)